ncbi:MAG: phosphotransferase [Caldilineaceae bacterium]|nr:phosphotransferase [Caldilineaceae bacterium]
MEPSQISRALEAARLTAGALGLHVQDTAVIHNSDRVVVRLIPGDVLVRIAPPRWQDALQFEVEVARRLTATGSPVGTLALRVDPRVYMRDDFVLTFWTYYAPAGDLAPTAYADALVKLHAGLRQIDLVAPPVTDRIAAWVAEVDAPDQNPDLSKPDRELLRRTFSQVQETMTRWDTNEQLLHGEPHPGNVLSTSHGPLFIDLHTCQRGPVEYDIAFVPDDVAAHYAGANPLLVHEFRVLMWAGFSTMRWRAADQFPDRDYWRIEGMNRLHAALGRAAPQL